MNARAATLRRWMALFLALPGMAAADAPRMGEILPVGVHRGETVVLKIRGERLDDARALHLQEGGGITFGAPKVINPGEIEVEAVVAPDCPQGEQRIRLRTASGWSYLRTLWVADGARTTETEPNNDREHAEKPVLPACIEAEMKPEDVDMFAVELKKDQRLTAVVEAMRLGRTMLDLHVSVVDANRFELAASDDTPLLAQDPMFSVVAPADGIYHVQVRDAAYEGADGARYRLRLGAWRQPVAVIPPGGEPGATVPVTWVFPEGGTENRPFTWPAETGTRRVVYAGPDGVESPVRLPVRVMSMPGVVESAPNDAREQATAGAPGLPVALHGILEKPGDEDWFAVPMKKEQGVEITAWAARLGSPADVAVDLFAPDGNHISGQDDTDERTDPRFSAKASADGVHYIRIRESLASGGSGMFYRVELVESAPSLALTLPAPGVNDSQSGQTVMVPSGNRVARVFNISRNRVEGALAMELRDAPPGVTLHPQPTGPGVTQVLALFSAGVGAPEAGAFADMIVRQAEGGVEGRFGTSAYLVTYQNNQPIYQTSMERLPLGVGAAVPLTVSMAPDGPIVRGGTTGVLVKAERGADFKQAVELKLPWMPSGISAPPSVTLPEGQSEVVYPLDADGGAATGSHPLVVTAHWGAGTEIASDFQNLVVEEPYVNGTLGMAAITAGGQATMALKMEHTRPFQGEAEAKLIGLPPGVDCSPARVVAGQAELVFTLRATPEAPEGNHDGVFCQLMVPVDGKQIVHRVGAGGKLRVDKPAANTPPPPPAPETTAAPAAAPTQTLSRLEQLRQQAHGKR